MSNETSISTIVINRDAVYLGARGIGAVTKLSRNTLKEYIKNGLKIRRDKSGKWVITGEDLYDYFKNLPLVEVKEGGQGPCG